MTPAEARAQFDELEAFCADTWSNLEAVSRMRRLYMSLKASFQLSPEAGLRLGNLLLIASSTASNARLVEVVRSMRHMLEPFFMETTE